MKKKYELYILIAIFILLLLPDLNDGYAQNKGAKQTKSGEKTVCLDNYYNNEHHKNKEGKLVPYHYIWQDTTESGFSKLGDIFVKDGARITELHSAPTKRALKKCNVYIIVDPDTPKENPHPHYMEEPAIRDIANWVSNGGFLILLANDKGNCEFTHLNHLAAKFGLHFNEVSLNDVVDHKYNMGEFINLPDHPIFRDVTKIYMKEICTIKVHNSEDSILKKDNQTVIAFTKHGKGSVLAVGDPWLYNEYIDDHELPKDIENYKAAENLCNWVLQNSD